LSKHKLKININKFIDMSDLDSKEVLLQDLFPLSLNFRSEYIWTDADEIGRGAFGKVFKGLKVSTK
jgi:hypothetical protein